MDLITYILGKKYTDAMVQGVGGAIAGKSAYEIAVLNGYTGTEAEWLSSLRGKDGEPGKDGIDGINGADGIDGDDGFSPVIKASEDTETVYVLEIETAEDIFHTPNLKGKDGEPGEQGIQGLTGATVGTGQVERTYAQLKAEKDSGALVEGTQYLLTDYATKYRMPYVNVIKETALDYPANTKLERLVLTAVSPNAFSPIAASLDYPNDIIYYNFDDNVCEDGVTPRKGFIRRRTDTAHNIDMPDDWRTMVWARLKATAAVWTSGEVTRGHYSQSGTNIYVVTRTGTPINATDSNYFQQVTTVNDYFWTGSRTLEGLTYNTTNYAERYTFNANINTSNILPAKSETIFPEQIIIEGSGIKENINGLSNNIWYFDTEANKPYGIHAATAFYNNTFGHGCRVGTFGANCYNNIFVSNTINVKFMSACFNNIVGNNCNNISLGNQSYNNILGASCGNNILGPLCNSNIFGSSGSYNTLHSGCLKNTFYSSCRENVFSPYCSDNIFGVYFTKNTLEPSIKNKNMTAIAELHNKTYGHTIFINAAGSVVSRHYNASNVAVFTAIP